MDDNKHYVVPIIYNKSSFFWLNISLTFIYLELKKKYYIKGASIGVYQGSNLQSSEKQLLFRAEWDQIGENSKIEFPHGQPHWHIYAEHVPPSSFSDQRN